MSERDQQDQLDVDSSSADHESESTETDTDRAGSEPADPTTNGWTGFRKGGNKFVTVRSSGSIAPNSAVVREHFGDAEAVQLFFKDGENLIGIRPVATYDSDNDRLYKLSKDGGSISINTHAFMKAWDIEHDETIRYRPDWDEEMEILIVDLDDDGTVVETGNATTGG